MSLWGVFVVNHQVEKNRCRRYEYRQQDYNSYACSLSTIHSLQCKCTFFPPYAIEPMTLVQWTTHSIIVLCKVAKQVNKNNKRVGWQQKEESYTQACSEKEREFNLLHTVHSLVEDFHGALLLKIDECPL